MAAVDGAFRASDLAEELMSVDKPNLLIASAFRRLVGSVDDISTADAVLWLRIGIGTAEEGTGTSGCAFRMISKNGAWVSARCSGLGEL